MKKLSERNTDEGIDILCELTPHISNILEDKEFISEIKKSIDFSGYNTLAEKYAIIIGKLSSIMNIILKKRRDDFYGIMSALELKPIEEIKNRNILKTLENFKILINDKELIDFFRLCMDTEGGE